jgi:hypothetical protein
MQITNTSSRAEQIARLNDAFRRRPGGDWMMTSGVQERGPLFVMKAIATVAAFQAFTTDNDPHGERDFGGFDLCGQRLFWKIDYYDRDLRSGSEDPADPMATRRVLTIMLASEY